MGLILFCGVFFVHIANLFFSIVENCFGFFSTLHKRENSLLELDAWLLQKRVGALFKCILMEYGNRLISSEFSSKLFHAHHSMCSSHEI